MTDRDATKLSSSPTESEPVAWPGTEPAQSPAATEPVNAARPGRSATRWGIALVVVALVVGLTVAAFWMLGAADEPEAYAYIPADSVMVMELRPELPGNQRQNLGTFLARFPGFADQSTLDQKLDEALGRLVDEMSDGATDYTTDVKPWLSGPMVLAALELPESSAMDAARFVAILDPDESVSCSTIERGASYTTESYRDATLRIYDTSGERMACVEAADLLIVGDLASVKVALDTKASGNDITDSDGFKAARAALDGERVAFGYLDMRTVVEQVRAIEPDAPGLGTLGRDEIPAWLGFTARIEGDAFVMDAVMPDTSDAASPRPARTLPADRVSVLAPRLPSNTVAVLEAHALGITFLNALDAARADPATASELRDLEQAAALLGGLEGLLGWMGDGSIVLTADGSEMGGGIVVATTDMAAAESRLDQLKSLFLLMGGAGLEIDEVPYGDGTITLIGLGDLGSELGGDLPPGIGDDLVIAVTVQRDLFVVGLDDAFVKSVLDAAPGSTLADQPAYRRAMALAGATNAGQGYVNMRGLLVLGEQLMDDEEAARYRSEIKPYMDAFEGAAITARTSGDLVRATFVMTVR
jgi:hypothetical protein